jgi:hypothetical protein
MHASHGGDRPAAADADPDASFRMRLAIADATFVAEGVTLGLLLKWAERAPPFDNLPPHVPARPARDSGALLLSADHRPRGA